jgi:hypothetical protein
LPQAYPFYFTYLTYASGRANAGRRAVDKPATDDSYQSEHDLSQQPPLILAAMADAFAHALQAKPTFSNCDIELKQNSNHRKPMSFTSKAQKNVPPHQAQIDVN